MFLEPPFNTFHTQRTGWIEVICGSMFSGKTEELIRRLKRARIASLNVAVFKPALDTRYAAEKVVSHDTNSLHATPIASARALLDIVDNNVDVLGIDEAQFFDDALTPVLQTLALRGVRVIVAGLDMDYLGAPFGPIPQLLAVAEYITKVHAICVHCGNLATHSYRITEDSSPVLLGEKESYEPRCRRCYALANHASTEAKRTTIATHTKNV